MLVSIIWQIIIFIFTIPLRIHARFSKEEKTYDKKTAIQIALINAVFIFILNLFLFVVFTKEISYIIIPILFSILGFFIGYQYLIKYERGNTEKYKIKKYKKSDLMTCNNCKSVVPKEIDRCNVCVAKLQ